MVGPSNHRKQYATFTNLYDKYADSKYDPKAKNRSSLFTERNTQFEAEDIKLQLQTDKTRPKSKVNFILRNAQQVKALHGKRLTCTSKDDLV